VKESQIQQLIRLALGLEKDLELMPNVVGQFKDDRGNVRRVGLGVGTPDLVGILAPSGRLFALEVKAEDGRTRPEQKVCHERWRARGAFVAVVRSPEDAKAALERARQGESQ